MYCLYSEECRFIVESLIESSEHDLRLQCYRPRVSQLSRHPQVPASSRLPPASPLYRAFTGVTGTSPKDGKTRKQRPYRLNHDIFEIYVWADFVVRSHV